MFAIPEYVVDSCNKVAISEGFTNYSTKVKSGSNHGDNFTSNLACVSICGKRKINDTFRDDELHLICKFAPLSAQRRKDYQIAALFDREILVYEKIFPLFAKFQEERGLSECDGFMGYPKYFTGVSDRENEEYVVIMEDIRPKGFTMWPKRKPTPLDQAVLTVQQLGRFHGISLALKDQKPDLLEELKAITDLNMVFFESGNMVSMLNSGLDMAIKALENEEHIKILDEVKSNTIPYLAESLGEDAFGRFGVIAHGDCWNNNLLYRYYNNETKAPFDLCFVDWQMAFYGSPAIDLLYYIFTATDKDLRDKEYDNLLQHYHTSLSEIVTKLGSDPEKLFSFADLHQQLKKCRKFPFLMAPLLAQLIMAAANDIPDLDELSEDLAQSEGDVILVKGFDTDTQLVYNKRIQELMIDLVGLGFYWN